MISKEDVKEVLNACGVSQEHVAKFSVDYDQAFGFEADLHPKNIIDNKHFELKTPDVVIKVDPAHSDLIETRIIGGVKYILVCADEKSKVPEPLMISKEDVKEVLNACGVSQEHVAKFSVDYDQAFGFEADLHPKNIIDNKHFELKTPDVVIKVDPAHSDLIETRIIGGVKYILVCADENVEVNGVNIHIQDRQAEEATV